MSSSLAPLPSDQPLMQATHEGNNLANLCRQIVKAAVVRIQDKNYLKVEGWESIAAADHCTPEIVKVECVSVMKGGMEVQGVRAEAILKRDADGYIISRGFGFVGEDEYNGLPDYYNMEAKAQTRAISRVCRHKYAFVLLLIDKNILTTPADEVPPTGFPSRSASATNGPPSRTRTWQPRAPQAAQTQAAPSVGTGQQTGASTQARSVNGGFLWNGTIRDVNIITGTKKSGDQTGQPYVMYVIKMDGGREAVTFDDKLGETCSAAVGYQCTLKVAPSSKRQGKFIAQELLPVETEDQSNQDDEDDYNE